MDVIPPSRTTTLASVRALRKALDFVELGKPRLMLLVLVTTAVGFYLGADRTTDFALLLPVIVGTALAATGSLALNQVMERETDARMRRTRERPLPDGRLGVWEATMYGAVLCAVGVVYLWYAVSALPALITATTIATYLFLYTPLKRYSPLCTIVGAVPGALPPVAGWAGARGSVGIEAALLFTILFLWQLPHSLAIAQLYREDYAAAGLKLLTTIPGGAEVAGRQTLIHTTALALIALLPTPLGMAGYGYLAVAFVAGALFVATSVAFAREGSVQRARTLLFASLLYLPVVLAAMACDRVWPLG